MRKFFSEIEPLRRRHGGLRTGAFSVNDRDPHSALKSEVTAKANRSNIEAVVARLQWGTDDVGTACTSFQARSSRQAYKKLISLRTSVSSAATGQLRELSAVLRQMGFRRDSIRIGF
jgi:hypothetical protein